jgi:hypothetical protein
MAICPAWGPAECLACPIDLALELLGAKAEINRAMERQMEALRKGNGGSRGGGNTIQVTSMDHLASILGAMNPAGTVPKPAAV